MIERHRCVSEHDSSLNDNVSQNLSSKNIKLNMKKKNMAWHVIVFQPVLMMIDDDDVVSLIFSSFLTQDDILRNMFHLKKKTT